MKKYIIILLHFSLANALFAQQELGLHFMRKVWQSTYTNPAFFSDSKVTIALPSVYTNYANTSFALSNIIAPDGDSTTINLNNILAQMKDQNFVAMHAQVEPIAVGFRIKDLQISLTTGIKTYANFGYNKEMFNLMANGNAAYIGQTVNIAPTIQVNAYTEYGIGAAYRFLKDGKLSVGGRVKYLIGIADLSTSKTHKEASLYTDPEFYQLKFKTDYELQGSGFITGNKDDIKLTTDNLQPFTQNTGIGFDIGAQLHVTDALSFSASVVDIGSITWKENTKRYYSKGEYVYDGLHLSDLVENKSKIDFVRITDTLKKTFGFQGLETGSYKTNLPTRFYLSGSYRVMKLIRVGALFYGESINQRFNPGIALSGNLELRKWFTCGLLFAYRNQRIGNVGLNMSFKGAGMQWFFATDNVAGLIVPSKMRNANIRTGLNIAIGGKNEE